MFQIRIHGRGGQGVVTGAEMLSVAAFIEGRHAQAFPSFGSERTGAPVVAFCRIADKEIRLREPIQDPDCLILQDPTLLKVVDVFAGLRPTAICWSTPARRFADLHLEALVAKTAAGPRGHRARDRSGAQARRRPSPNAALLGAFAALTGLVHFDSVKRAIAEAFPGRIGEANIAAAQEAYDFVVTQERAATVA